MNKLYIILTAVLVNNAWAQNATLGDVKDSLWSYGVSKPIYENVKVGEVEAEEKNLENAEIPFVSENEAKEVPEELSRALEIVTNS